MATGDLEGNLERLKLELRRTKYAAELDEAGLRLGELSAILPILQHSFLSFSRHVAHDLLSNGYELQGKTPERFVETALKAMREHYGLKPRLTTTQFLDRGFAERKVMLLHDVICRCVSSHNEAVRLQRVASATVPQADSRVTGQRPSKDKEAGVAGLKPTIICHEAAEAMRVPGDRGPHNDGYTSAGPQSSLYAFTSSEDQEEGRGARERSHRQSSSAGCHSGRPSRPASGRSRRGAEEQPNPRSWGQKAVGSSIVYQQSGGPSLQDAAEDVTRHRASHSLGETPAPCSHSEAEAQQVAGLLRGLLASLQHGDAVASVLDRLSSGIAGLRTAAVEPLTKRPMSETDALRQRVCGLEGEVAALKTASEQTKQQLQARVVVLETRFRAWEGTQQRPVHNPWTNPIGAHHPLTAQRYASAQPASGNPWTISQPRSAAGSPRKDVHAVLGGKENAEGQTKLGEALQGQGLSRSHNWEGYESTEKLIQDIQNRYAEAQHVLQQQCGPKS